MEGTKGRVAGLVHVIVSRDEVEALHVEQPGRLAYVTQTTLNVDDTEEILAALKRRFPAIQGPNLDGICYATQNRQQAVRVIALKVDVLLVVGARNSSNPNHLRGTGEEAGVPAYLVQDATELKAGWLSSARRVGITAGASTPEVLVEEVLAAIRRHHDVFVTEVAHALESVSFRPAQIADDSAGHI